MRARKAALKRSRPGRHVWARRSMRMRQICALVGAAAGLASGCGAVTGAVVNAPVMAEAAPVADEAAPPPEPRMPPAVRALLARRCGGCHVREPRDRAGWGSVLDLGKLLEARFIVPGEPGASKLLALVAAGEM